ncbi:hypothetical protein EDD18DRAFT_44528 [Armillaria luteobubalina]|uniref:Uncharacterized protein n=1 Tax=Armillaria luteobubalina TaxID=153913 RepID=A0AA39QQV7_9AGAR|nr:hypothetical protein EDD18DRAFT_44528 [Armillaria luteobubalina]
MQVLSQTSDDDTDWIPDPPTTMLSWLKKVQEAESGATLETELDPDSLSWFRDNFDIVTEMYRGKWELVDDKAIVTIPTIVHGAFLKELRRSLYNSARSRDLQIGSSTVPIYNGLKIPDLNIFDTRDPTQDGYGVPRVSFEVAYGESRTKLLWGLVRLVLGLDGHLRLAYGVNIHSPEMLHYLEIIAFASGGTGTLRGAKAKEFRHGKVYGRNGDGAWKIVPQSEPPEYKRLRMLTSEDENDHTYVDCRFIGTWKITEEEGDIVIPGRSLFLDDEGDDLILSGAQLWRDTQKCIGLHRGINAWKAERRGKGEPKRKIDGFEVDLQTLYHAKPQEV